MKKAIISIIVIALAVGGIAYVLQNNKAESKAITSIVAQENASVAVYVDTVSYQNLRLGYHVNGVFAPKQEVKISAETSGRVTKVLVDEGDFVRPGQVLAIIESDRQQVDVANAKAVFQNAKAELKRFKSAYATGGVTKQKLDQVELQLDNAKSNLESAKIAATDVNIRASFAGIVNTRNVESGAYVSPGSELFDIVDVSSLKLKVDVDEKNIGGVSLGQQVEVLASALPNENWSGKVTFIAPKANGNLSFPVELEIQNKDKTLRAGMYGTAYFGRKDSSKTLVIPRDAFVGSISSNTVFVAKEGKAYSTKVIPGRVSGKYVEVISGLNDSDVVITAGQINLENNSPIEIIK